MTASTAIIGGSGLYNLPDAKISNKIEVDTPFGNPSAPLVILEINNHKVAFLPRHGEGHTINPSHLPVKANIYALKTLGVKRIISISAVGSLQENIPPEDFVVPDQLIDRTKARASTFFEEGMVGHISFAEPFCTETRQKILEVLTKNHEKSVHEKGTYLCMEGPAFSTRAESHLYRSWGASVIGMTALPEAKLAREAEICYATIAMSTDYDCWKESEEAVTLDMVIKHMTNNTDRIKKYIPELIDKLSELEECSCHSASECAIFTVKEMIPQKTKEKLAPLFGKYF